MLRQAISLVAVNFANLMTVKFATKKVQRLDLKSTFNPFALFSTTFSIGILNRRVHAAVLFLKSEFLFAYKCVIFEFALFTVIHVAFYSAEVFKYAFSFLRVYT